MNAEAQQLIAALGLARLPHEGGWFRQSWRTAAGSAILFLLTPEDFSALHRMRTDELWHFYAGDPVEHVQLDPRTSEERVIVLGPDVLAGQQPQLTVAGGVWQGARVWVGGGRGSSTALRAGWALLGCTMAPAWAEEEFELGGRSELLKAFPAQAALVAALTR